MRCGSRSESVGQGSGILLTTAHAGHTTGKNPHRSSRYEFAFAERIARVLISRADHRVRGHRHGRAEAPHPSYHLRDRPHVKNQRHAVEASRRPPRDAVTGVSCSRGRADARRSPTVPLHPPSGAPMMTACARPTGLPGHGRAPAGLVPPARPAPGPRDVRAPTCPAPAMNRTPPAPLFPSFVVRGRLPHSAPGSRSTARGRSIDSRTRLRGGGAA
jgi:hypothetical protein